MQALVNGQTTELRDGATIADLLQEMGFAGKRIAVELNGEIVPRSRHPDQAISPGDRLEIVHAIGGGTR